jgi:spermidine/putrescine-binding protein
MDNAWEIFWNAGYAGITGLYDDYREALTVGLFRDKFEDVNTGDAAAIESAQNNLIELTDLIDVRYTIDGAYAKMPEGVYGLHQAWSGDMVATPYYISRDTDPHWLQYYWPAKNPNTPLGTIGNDTLAIPRNAKNPVLAHAFLNYYCDFKVSMKNFSWVGYQPAQTQVVPEELLGPWNDKGWIDGYVLDSMPNTIVLEDDFTIGKRHIALPGEAEQLWQQAFATVQAGA